MSQRGKSKAQADLEDSWEWETYEEISSSNKERKKKTYSKRVKATKVVVPRLLDHEEDSDSDSKYSSEDEGPSKHKHCYQEDEIKNV